MVRRLWWIRVRFFLGDEKGGGEAVAAVGAVAVGGRGRGGCARLRRRRLEVATGARCGGDKEGNLR